MATWRDKDVVFCLLGGMLLGVTASVRMALWGKVTGSSGILAKAIKPNTSEVSFTERSFAILFCAGLIVGGAVCNEVLPEAFEDWDDLPWSMLIMAGLLVGFGSQLGNGCTSGHGICGISSFRLRSLAATCTFMTTGVVTAVVANTRSYQHTPFHNYIKDDDAYLMLGVTAIACILYAAVGWYLGEKIAGGASDDTKNAFRAFGELLTGYGFAVGLSVSNMTRISATISFLDVRYWNPALAFVMMGAIAVTASSYYVVFKNDKPFLEIKFTLAQAKEIDAPLIAGASLFGVGWGLMGACPAPAITNFLATPASPRSFIYMATLITGVYLHEIYKALLAFRATGGDDKVAEYGEGTAPSK